MNKLIYLLFIILLFGCKKNKPLEGKYIGYFNGTYIDSGVVIEKERIINFHIIKSTKDYIEMKECINCTLESFKIKKDKNNVDGTLEFISVSGASPGYVNGPITINGIWSKEDKSYFINGIFSYDYEIIDSPLTRAYNVNGKFEIKSTF